MNKYLLIFPMFMISTGLFGQKQDYIWHLGIDQGLELGLQTMEVNFGRGAFDVRTQDTPVGFDHNNMAICDKDGQLLFYTNGCAIVNRNQEIMPNGHRMNWDSLFTLYTGWNEDCDIGYPGTQNILVLDDPAYSEGYYLIHKSIYFGEDGNTHTELRSSYVDLALENGLGDVVYVDSLVAENYVPQPSYLSAIRHENQVDWWILQLVEESDVVSTFLIDDIGIHRQEDQSAHEFFELHFSGGGGTARFSPDGSKYSIFSRANDLNLYDFDRSTGLLSNHQKIELFDSPRDSFDHKFGSVEWAPNGRFLYTCVDDTLLQVDSWEADIQNDGIRFIDEYNGTLDPFFTTFYIMALAPDCKIYMCSGNGSNSYHVINNPNELGTACDFVQNGIKLPQDSGRANIPLHPRWRVDEAEVCDSTITSIFGQDVYYRKKLQLYPNPTDGPATIILPDDLSMGTIVIYNIKGEIMMQKEFSNAIYKHQLNISELSVGSYHVEVYPKNNKDRIFYGAQIIKQ